MKVLGVLACILCLPSAVAQETPHRIFVTITPEPSPSSTALSQSFRTLGFTEPIPALTGENASKASIQHLLDSQLPAQLTPADDLVIYISARTEDAYVVPAGADAHNAKADLPLNDILESAGALPARHMLILLDTPARPTLGPTVDPSLAAASPERLSRHLIAEEGLAPRVVEALKSGASTDADLTKRLSGALSARFLGDNSGEMTFASAAAAEPAVKPLAREAIVIGCGGVESGAPNAPLRYATDDARYIGRAFENLGYSVDYVTPPTFGRVQSALAKAASASAGSLGSLVVYFAGRAILRNNERYLALEGFDEHTIAVTSISYRQIQTMLERAPARVKAFFFDADFEALTPNPSLAIPPVLRKALEQTWQPGGGYSGIFAIRDSFVLEDATLRHSVFTYFLARGLYGEAASQEGVITLESLDAYVRVQSAAWLEDRPPPVVWFSAPPRDFPLGVVRDYANYAPPPLPRSK